MGLLNMTPGEYDYYTDNLAEAVKLIGQDAVYYPPQGKEDLYYDYDVETSEHFAIGVIFDDNPRPVLKKNGWLVEDEELPFTASVVAKDRQYSKFKVQEKALIVLASTYGIQAERKFIVSAVRGNSIDPLAFVCKLTPYREKLDVQAQVEKKKEEPKYDKEYEVTNEDEETVVIHKDYPDASYDDLHNDDGYSWLKR